MATKSALSTQTDEAEQRDVVPNLQRRLAVWAMGCRKAQIVANCAADLEPFAVIGHDGVASLEGGAFMIFGAVRRRDVEHMDLTITRHFLAVAIKGDAGVVEAIGPSVQTTGADTKVIYQGDVIVGRLAYGAGPVRVSVAGAFRNV